MHTKSIWNVFSHSTSFPELKEDIVVETLIIGGGITGISTGHQLSLMGHSTAILEKEKIGGGASSHSTGNLYVTIDRMLSKLKSKYDLEVVKEVVAARREAMDQIVENVEKYHIDCDLERRSWYLYSKNSSDDEKIQKEYELAMDLGLNVKVAEANEIPYQFSRGIKLEEQVQFNPMKYVQGMAKSINTSTCHIFENTAVTYIERDVDEFRVHTDKGIVKAKNLVHATHTPKGFMFLQSMLGPYREYGIACKLKGDIKQRGIFWGYHDQEKFSTRTYETDAGKFLIVVGKAHKVGQSENNRAMVLELEDFAREHFSVEEVIYRWGGQHYRPADLLPYIGEYEDNLYVATGYSTDGLTYGCLAGKIIKDLITSKDNELSKLFNPSRHQPLKSAKEFAKENINVAKQYLDLLPDFTDDEFSDIPAGEGKVIHKNGKKLAAYRSADNSLHVRSAICTHLGCVVNWNNAEKSWDCPCHGSRFKTNGAVLEGPALKALDEVKDEDMD